MFAPTRDEARRFMIGAWAKFRAGEPLSDMERVVSSLVAMHPEYHALLENGERSVERDWTPDGGAMNPFLHLSLHLAVAEQLAIDQPPGIRAEFERIRAARGDEHAHCTRCSNAWARQCGRRSAWAPAPTRPSTSGACAGRVDVIPPKRARRTSPQGAPRPWDGPADAGDPPEARTAHFGGITHARNETGRLERRPVASETGGVSTATRAFPAASRNRP